MNNEEKILSMLEGVLAEQKSLAEDQKNFAKEVDKRFDGMFSIIETVVMGQRKLSKEVAEVKKSSDIIRGAVARIENDLGGEVKVMKDGQVILEEYKQDHEQRITSVEDITEKHSVELVSLREAR